MKKIKYILIGAGLVVGSGIAFSKVSDWLYSQIDYSFANPTFKVNGNGIVMEQEVTLISKLKVTATFKEYIGETFYKDIKVGDTMMLPFSLSQNQPATTKIITTISPMVGELIGDSIKDPWQIIYLIQRGVTTKGKLYLSVGKKVIGININENVTL